MEIEKIQGMNTAVVTPMFDDGSVNYDEIDHYAEFVIAQGLSGVFVCGSSGESLLLSTEERKQIVRRWMRYADRLNILVHVGHTSYVEACELARDAGKLGVRAISAMGPCFMQPQTLDDLIGFNAKIAAAAPETPFYYYHIPGRVGVDFDMTRFLAEGAERIPNLSGLKFTSQDTYTEFKCIRLQDGRFDILHGHDETFLLGLTMGARSCIGTSLNVNGPAFARIAAAFRDGDLERAEELQARANEVVDLMCRYNVIATIKEMLSLAGIKAGPARLPNGTLTPAQKADVKARFFELFPAS